MPVELDQVPDLFTNVNFEFELEGIMLSYSVVN